MRDNKSTNPAPFGNELNVDSALSDAIERIDIYDQDKDIHLSHIDGDDYESTPTGTLAIGDDLNKTNKQPVKPSEQLENKSHDTTA